MEKTNFDKMKQRVEQGSKLLDDIRDHNKAIQTLNPEYGNENLDLITDEIFINAYNKLPFSSKMTVHRQINIFLNDQLEKLEKEFTEL